MDRLRQPATSRSEDIRFDCIRESLQYQMAFNQFRQANCKARARERALALQALRCQKRPPSNAVAQMRRSAASASRKRCNAVQTILPGTSGFCSVNAASQDIQVCVCQPLSVEQGIDCQRWHIMFERGINQCALEFLAVWVVHPVRFVALNKYWPINAKKRSSDDLRLSWQSARHVWQTCLRVAVARRAASSPRFRFLQVREFFMTWLGSLSK